MAMCLEALGEVVAKDAGSIEDGPLIRERKGSTKLLDRSNARSSVLEEQAQGAKHGQTAVLDLLHLLFPVLLGGVLEVERVEASLSKAQVTGVLITSNHSLDASKLNAEDNKGDLPQGLLGNRGKGLEWVDFGKSISRNSKVRVAREMNIIRDEVSNYGKHGNTGMHDLSLLIPFE